MSQGLRKNSRCYALFALQETKPLILIIDRCLSDDYRFEQARQAFSVHRSHSLPRNAGSVYLDIYCLVHAWVANEVLVDRLMTTIGPQVC